MTSVSAWAFTYGVESMGLPEEVAACIPGAFYSANLLSRGVILRASAFIPSSGLLHYGAMATVLASLLFSALAARTAATPREAADSESSSPMVLLLLACFALLGAGFSPCYSHTMVAMHKHGELSSKDLLRPRLVPDLCQPRHHWRHVAARSGAPAERGGGGVLADAAPPGCQQPRLPATRGPQCGRGQGGLGRRDVRGGQHQHARGEAGATATDERTKPLIKERGLATGPMSTRDRRASSPR
ncbi:unnamed protein product [Prorocentrum cordatum]|uniref:Uncharacterized protein n=1 Tax=Prorocentrum cordatum TaxID=2364126 RepID=A0ABN9XDQ5_9DINO|nr:unnamed protein product [Polarella glacialis]